MQKPKTPIKKPAPQPTVMKNGKPVKLVKSSKAEAFKNGGSVTSKKAMGGKVGKKSC